MEKGEQASFASRPYVIMLGLVVLAHEILGWLPETLPLNTLAASLQTRSRQRHQQ